MPKINIDEVYTKEASYPLIVNFQNGYVTDKFKAESCDVLLHEKTGVKCVTTEINGMLYAGDEEQEQIGKTMILAKNRKTGKVRLIEVGHAQVKPILHIDETTSLLDTSYLELSRKFGSKKQKQQVEHREKLKVNIQTVTEQMQNVTEAITEDKLDLSSYNKTDSDDFYVPPINRNADKVEEVYDIDKILTEEQYDKVYTEIEDQDYNSDLLPFIQNIVSGKKLSQRHTVLAIYANCLIKFSLTLVKELTKKSHLVCPHSATLNNIILSNFALQSNGKITRPMPFKDKALCHAVVFALLINNLKFPLEGFCEDTKLTANTATTKIKVTGATIVTSGSKKFVNLKLPLSAKGGFRRKSAKF